MKQEQLSPFCDRIRNHVAPSRIQQRRPKTFDQLMIDLWTQIRHNRRTINAVSTTRSTHRLPIWIWARTAVLLREHQLLIRE
jgi:hypothetical protein